MGDCDRILTERLLSDYTQLPCAQFYFFFFKQTLIRESYVS